MRHKKLVVRQQYPNLLRCANSRLPWNNFVITSVVADKYYDTHARRQYSRCSVSMEEEKRESVKWDKFSRMRSDDVSSDETE